MSFVADRIKKSLHSVGSAFKAQRDVPSTVSQKQIERDIPVTWEKDNPLMDYVNRYMLRGSGAGFVTSPYTSQWDLVWGVTPIEDLPKYKELYTFTPYIKAAIDVTVNLAISNGFELDGGNDKVREWLIDWLDEQNILRTLRIVATDMLVFGNAYLEICRDEETGQIAWLKPLDPVYMRPRRDAYGNVFGYIQLLSMPPVVFTSEDIVHFKWGAKSWWFESAFGTSLLRPLLRIQALIKQFEDDMSVILHVYAKPMLIFKAGTPEKPLGDNAVTELIHEFQNRKPGTDLYVRGDVVVEPILSMTKDISVQFWLDYLYKQREAVLGVPKIFLGESEGTNRATSDTVMQEYVTRLRMLQEIIGDVLETVLFKQLIDEKFGVGKEIPHIAWRPIWEARVEDKAKYVQGLVQQGIITVVEARLALGYSAQPGPEQGVLSQQSGQARNRPAGKGGAVIEQDGKRYVVEELSDGESSDDRPAA